MKTLSLLEPWASLIACGAKRIETRSWKHPYRGPLLIHASKGCKAENMNLAWQEPFFSALKGIHIIKDGKTALQYSPGCIIATCNLVDCIEMTPENIAEVGYLEKEFGIYEPGRYMWILEDVRRIDPIPAKGRLMLWDFDLDRG